MQGKKKNNAPQGRYDGNLDDTHIPQSRRSTPQLNVRTALGSVKDPHETNPEEEKQRISVSINRNVDLLENELSYKRISEAAYRTGRAIQATLERPTGLRTTFRAELGGSYDMAKANENRIINSIDNARKSIELMHQVEVVVGIVGARVLRDCLESGLSFKQIAEKRGRRGARGIKSVADQFRWLLESVSDSWAATGKDKKQ